MKIRVVLNRHVQLDWVQIDDHTSHFRSMLFADHLMNMLIDGRANDLLALISGRSGELWRVEHRVDLLLIQLGFVRSYLYTRLRLLLAGKLLLLHLLLSIVVLLLLLHLVVELLLEMHVWMVTLYLGYTNILLLLNLLVLLLEMLVVRISVLHPIAIEVLRIVVRVGSGTIHSIRVISNTVVGLARDL